MSDAVRIDLFADRGVAFSHTLTREGVNWTSATFSCQIRLYKDAPGSPIVSLTGGAGVFLTYGGSATVSAHITAGRLPAETYNYVNPTTGVKYVAGDTVTLSVLLIGISKATMKGTPTGLIPYPAERGDDLVLAWDLLVDADGAGSGEDTKEFYGNFTVRGTVVQ